MNSGISCRYLLDCGSYALLIPGEQRYPGISMELKWKGDLDAEALEALAEEALIQIDDKRYDSEMREDGIKDILKLGFAFSGKNVSIKTK